MSVIALVTTVEPHLLDLNTKRDLYRSTRNSANFRASIRSLLLPSFNRAAFRGSQTTSWLTWGFKRSCNQAAEVPSSKVRDRVPCNPDRKSVVLGKECRSRWSPYH